jgi:hypothetical protein
MDPDLKSRLVAHIQAQNKSLGPAAIAAIFAAIEQGIPILVTLIQDLIPAPAPAPTPAPATKKAP